MNKLYFKLIVILIGLSFSNNVFGQLTLSGEIRPRTEFENGFKQLRDFGDPSFTYVSQRSRINVDYKNENLRFGFIFQDIRHWGATPTLAATDPFLSVHEAWGEILFNPQLSLKLGRQELVYDDHRIFGSVAWAQQARSHDLGLIKYEGDFKMHFGLAYHEGFNGNTPANIGSYYKGFQFLWFNKHFEALDMSILLLNNGLQGTQGGNMLDETRYSQTLGTFVKTSLSGVALDASFYYQTGKDRADRSLSAYDFAVNAKYNIQQNFALRAGLEILSGTDDDAVGTDNNSFAPFYGTNHKFNGFMDYFYVGNHGDNVGLNDFNAGLDFASGKWTFKGTGHYFQANAKLIDPNTAAEVSSNLGLELDFTAIYKYSDVINFEAGYSQMFGTSSMEILKGGDKGITNNWAYLMITIKPKFFDSSK